MKIKLITLLTICLLFSAVLNSEAQNKEIILSVELNGNKTLNISKTPLKYDKDFAFSFCFDDGLLDSYQLGFRLFNGGTSEVGGLNFPGLYYSDGCGNQITFTASIAWFTANRQGFDIHNGTNTTNMTYSQAVQLYANGWSFLNHSYDHSDGNADIDYMDQLTRNDQIFMSRVGHRLRYVVPPSGDFNYIAPAFDFGAPAVFTSNAGYSQNNGVPYKVDDIVTTYQPVFWRNGINSDDDNAESLTKNIKDIYDETDSGNHLWWNEFTHHISYERIGGSIEFVEFRKYMENLANEYGSSGRDNCLFANSVEVFEYLVVRDYIDISQSRSGRNATITLDYSSCPDYLRYNDISIFLEGESIKSLSISSPASISYAPHKNGYLVNVSLPSSYFTGISLSPGFNSNSIEIYPNPAVGHFFVKTNFILDPDRKARLIDFSGRTHYPDSRIFDQYYCKIDLDENTFPPGLYIVIIEDSKGSFHSKKIILK